MPERNGYDDSAVEQYAAQQSNAAAPAGLHQQAQAAAGVASGDSAYDNSLVGQYAGENGYAAQAGPWYAGQNLEGTNNGWNTDFTEAFISGQDEAAAEGRLNTFFEDGGTGVVTWDHKAADGTTSYQFGDVVKDGKVTANIYDDFERDDANLLMAAWLYDGKQQARIFSDSDRMGALDRAVNATREENNLNIPKALAAAEFGEDVKDKAEEWDDEGKDNLIVGGGLAGGAGTGAAAGALVGGPIGAGVGAVVGGIAGGLGSYLNKDELTEQAARAYEITAMANREQGTLAAVGEGLQQWGGFATQLTSPLTQLSHGLVDAEVGKVGDGQSGYYAQEGDGDYKRPAWAKPLGLAAALGDGLMQFVSPINRAVYTAQMGSTIGGESIGLALTGTDFDPREGGFDNIFKDDDGNFDPVSGAAGIFKVGIDAVQMTGMLALAGRSGREAKQLGGQVQEAAGMRFILDADGKVANRSLSITGLLAPSESVAWATATRKARVTAQLEGRAVTADDYYNAAMGLANGSNKLKAALVNGFGEGYEEFVQGLLEPISMDGSIHAGDLADSFLQGAAAGAGMSLGATFSAPGQDGRLMAQAYALETLRRGGVEPDETEFRAQWADATDTEKRVMATRNRADVTATKQALDEMARQQAATLVASGADAAKAIDAKRKMVEKDLKNGSDKTDAFHVIGGLLDARDDRRGEAVEASALTIAHLLEDRLKGLGIQLESLAEEKAGLDQVEKAGDFAELEQLERTVQAAQRAGAAIVAAVNDQVNRIYAADETTAAQMTADLNRMLETAFDRGGLNFQVEGFNPAELADAAAQFVTLLHSREPKLDSGSYVALLPRASWELTGTRSDNLLQVNTDILSAINGDFDGDKLRSEYQLILPTEQYLQARSGQFLGGAGAQLDIAVRNFDEALSVAIGSALESRNGALYDEAEAVLSRIETAITARYGTLMAPSAMVRVFEEFRTALVAGSEEARVTLLNGLAREASDEITDLGRQTLTNEWLWASKVIRAELQGFQLTYRKLRTLADQGPSATAEVADFDTPVGTNRRKDRAVNTAQTLALFAEGNSLFRKFQKIHYSFYNSSVLSAAGAEKTDLYEIAAFYADLSRGVTRPEINNTGAADAITGRVLAMLGRIVDDALRDPDLAQMSWSPAEAMTILANVKVQDVWYDGNDQLATDGTSLSLAQLLLKRALEADMLEHKATFATDEKLQAKHARLRSMTISNDVAGEVNAERAFLEVFGAVPFSSSLGAVVGNLAPGTTPEQWLKLYQGLDANGRRQMEALYTDNVPEYLSRSERSNLPYAMVEATRREVTPYRSMLDAMMAVGRSELTFNPDVPNAKARTAFGGRKADAAFRTVEDLEAVHDYVRQALGRTHPSVEQVQRLFDENRAFARQVFAAIPDAAANALFEFRGSELYVAPWLYEMFTIDKPAEAAMYYWRNLTLAQWNSTQVTGRKYNDLTSRFQRLLHQLAQEPGQLHYELLVRELNSAKSLPEFFLWLNRTPGFRGDQAVLLPFFDDVADFEADTGGAWMSTAASGDQRVAIAAMRKGAKQLAETMAFRRARAATDADLLRGIKKAHAGATDATPEDLENLRKLELAVKTSIELPRGFAPTAMRALGLGALRSFDPHSTDKGVTPDSYQPLGEFQALMDAFGFVPGLERVFETLTAHSVGSLSNNIGDLARYGGQAMDAYGRTIEWEPMSVDQAIELLDNPATEPLALALLVPSALDLAGGKMVERTLFEASLKDLLDGSHYADLYQLDGDGALDKALRYLNVIESRARTEGAHFDVQRYIHDLAITRLSGLPREANEDDFERIFNETTLDVARWLQLQGQVLATPESRDADVLGQLREYGLKHLRESRSARAGKGFVDSDTGKVVEAWIESLVTDLEKEQLERLKQLADTFKGKELDRQREKIEAQHQVNIDRIRGVLEDDIATTVAARFRITGDPATDEATRVQLFDYATSQVDFGARAPESARLWAELADHKQAGTFPAEGFDWETLSRSAMGVYLADEVIRVASHVSLPAFPKGDPAVSAHRFFKYFDPSYGYLADLLDADSPVSGAAAWLHLRANQERTSIPTKSLESALTRTILNEKKLDNWTPGAMAQIVSVQERMDSAGAGQAIPMAGNGPKRNAAPAMATKRDGRVPEVPPTTLAIPGTVLSPSSSVWAEVAPGVPLALLDNRFYSAVRIDGYEVPLDAANLGFTWTGESEPTGFRYIALDRLRRVVSQYAEDNDLGLGDITVEVDFFHPDTRPAGPEWANNVYFDGMSHSVLPDGNASLLATLWSDNGGEIAKATQHPLDAGKKGLRAIMPFVRLDPLARVEAQLLFETQGLAAMLRAKTKLAMTYDDGSGLVDPASYNAVFKHLALHHIVVGFDANGERAALTAAQVIAKQTAGEELGLTEPTLRELSPDVLRTLAGETGDQGVDRFFDDEYLLNLDQIEPLTEITPAMLKRFPGLFEEPGTLADTVLAHSGMQRTMTVKTYTTDAERNSRQERIQFLESKAADIRAARYNTVKDKDEYHKGYLAVLRLAMGLIGTEKYTFDFAAYGLPMAPKSTFEAKHTERLLQHLSEVNTRDRYERGWQVVDEAAHDWQGGMLSVESLDADRDPQHHLAKGDIAVVVLSTFEKPEKDVTQVTARVEKTLRYLANTGATIALGSGNAKGDLRYESAQFLMSLGYAPVAGSKHLFEPIEYAYKSQNEKALDSTYVETDRVRPARNAVTFLTTDPMGTDENTAAVNTRSAKLRDRKLVNGILPSAAYPHYGILDDEAQGSPLHVRVLTHLRSISDPANSDARAELAAMAGADPAREMEFSEALDRFHEELVNHSTLGLREGRWIKVGDIIPFVHPDGKVILYRHGFELPKKEDLPDLFAQHRGNVILAPSKREAQQTANDGIVRRVEERAKYGRALVIESPLQAYGNKVQLEWNGMKYVVVPPTAEIDAVLEVPVFANGTMIDLFSDVKSADSKEATYGRVNSYRNALTFFQFDFTDDLVKFFFPGQPVTDPKARVLVKDLMFALSRNRELELPTIDAAVLAKAGPAIGGMLTEFAAAQTDIDPSWTTRLTDEDPSSVIARALITYVLTPAGDIDNVLKSAGFSHKDAGSDLVWARRVPGLFAELLNQGVGSETHKELIRRFDAQLHRGPKGEGFRLNQNWTVTAFGTDGRSVEGYLQFGEAHSSGDNPLLDGQAYDVNERQTVSPHNALAAGLSVGAITAHTKGALRKSREFARSFKRGGGVTKLSDPGESLWQMLVAVPNEKDAYLAGWRRETPAETIRRRLAREEIVGLYHPLDDERWTPEERATYEDLTSKVLGKLNLYGAPRALVDTWVRQHLGRPYGLDPEGNDRSVISGADAIEIAKAIRTNVDKGLLPVAGANIPLLDINQLTSLYMANLNRDGGWAPVDPETGQAIRDWDGWVASAFSTAFIMPADYKAKGAEPDFHPMYQLAVDGLMHGYQGATSATRFLPVSTDELKNRLLIDPETNRRLVSVFADENLLATDPILFNTSLSELDEIVGGNRIYAPGRDGADPASAMGRQRKRFDRWHKENDAARNPNRTLRGLRAPGQTFLDHTTKTSAMWRSLINLRVGNALFNPALVVSAPLEAFYRRNIDAFADALAGEGAGRIGRAQARLAESLPKGIKEFADQAGLTPAYSAEELKQLNKMVYALSSRTEFKALVYKELMFQYPSMPGIGKIEKWLEKYAKFGARIQDPAWGMLPKDLARIYMKTVMRRMAADPTGENIYSTDTLLKAMTRNPEWLRDNDLETHNMAIAAIANIRSIKPTVLSLITRGVVEPLSENPSFVANSAGNLLKMLTVFQNFWANSFINMTGLQGVADLAAFHLDGKKKGKLTRRMQAAMRGEEFQPEEDEFYDMSEVLEGLDLADSFIRGGVTHTALFTLGMMAGGLGLSGEDDEEKFRRRQAELQGAGFVHDPRDLANDYRNKDAIFLDWLPMGLDALFKVDPSNPDSRAMAQMNWTLRYFASPIIGFERFYQTGDFTEVIHGFTDALGAHPVVNTQLVNEFMTTAAELHMGANDAIERGDEAQGGHLLITAVGVLERMLFENAAVNMIYVGTDRYDRDPYKQPKLDSDGNPQVDVRGNPYETDVLKDYSTEAGVEGEVRQGYVDRDERGAQLRVFTENRFGMAFLGSLFTGVTGGGFTTNDLWRQNMVPKVKEVELLPVDQDELKADILLAFQGANTPGSEAYAGASQMSLTEEEAANIIKQQYRDAGIWYEPEEVEKQAAVMAANSRLAAMSIIDEAGREQLTDDGRRSVLEGLRSGATTLGTAALNGVWMSGPQRDKLRDDIAADLVLEGVEAFHMTKEQATWRMRRIMFGTNAPTGSPRLIDLIYTDQIPWSDTLEYNQLNTTYVVGPNGYPQATGFTRDGLRGALGFNPLLKQWTATDMGLDSDARSNAVDSVAGINTGMRALEPRGEGWEIPSVEDRIKDAEEAIVKAIEGLDLSGDDETKSGGSGSGWQNFGHGGRGGYSRRGYGGGGGSGYSQFTRMYALPGGVSPYGNSIPFINTSNPILRRADIRRERVWSERGRLKQWQ